MEAIARLRGVLAALIAASAACLLGANAALAGTLDQQQTDLGGGGYGIQSAQSIAQTFTAAATGGVDQVDLALYRGSTVPTLPLNVEIRDVSSGKPGSTVLAGQTLAGAALTTSPAFVSINFSPPAPVTAGTQYAIVASSAQTLPAFYAWVGSAAPDPYPAGGSFAQPFPPSGAWTAITTPQEDMGFKTYVLPTPPAPPPLATPPAPTGQRAAALAKCKHKHSKRKRRKCRRRANRLPV